MEGYGSVAAGRQTALLGWARELTRPPDEKEERIKRLLHDPREMENGEFEQVASQVLNEVEAGEIADFGIYLRLYDGFERFVDEGLVSMTRQQVLDNFIGGLEKAQKADRLKPNPRLKLEIEHPGLATKTEEGRTLRQHVLEANEKILRRGICERVQASASRLQSSSPRQKRGRGQSSRSASSWSSAGTAPSESRRP